jgi:hypothetical protein
VTDIYCNCATPPDQVNLTSRSTMPPKKTLKSIIPKSTTTKPVATKDAAKDAGKDAAKKSGNESISFTEAAHL